jgi:hypothetical protein
VHHAVGITGMYRVTQIRKSECVINATKNGWHTKLVLIISIKPQSSPHILGTIKYSLVKHECVID